MPKMNNFVLLVLAKALGLLVAKSKVTFPLKPSAHFMTHLEWTMGLVFGVTKPSSNYKPFRTRLFCVWVKAVQ